MRNYITVRNKLSACQEHSIHISWDCKHQESLDQRRVWTACGSRSLPPCRREQPTGKSGPVVETDRLACNFIVGVHCSRCSSEVQNKNDSEVPYFTYAEEQSRPYPTLASRTTSYL
jgi:hypothetical protein